MQHLGSVWKQSNEAMEKGLADGYAALQAEGLKATRENEMRQFNIERLQMKDLGTRPAILQTANI